MTQATNHSARRRDRRARARQAAAVATEEPQAAPSPLEAKRAQLAALEEAYWAGQEVLIHTRDAVALAELEAQAQLQRNDIYRLRLELGQ